MVEILRVLQEAAMEVSGRGEEPLSPTNQETITIMRFGRYTTNPIFVVYFGETNLKNKTSPRVAPMKHGFCRDFVAGGRSVVGGGGCYDRIIFSRRAERLRTRDGERERERETAVAARTLTDDRRRKG